jgi:hypothetical protein
MVALLLALLLPAQFLRSSPQMSDNPGVTLAALPFPQTESWPEGLTLTGLWQIGANDWRMGGWSALVAREGGLLEAFSDRGARVLLDPSGAFHEAKMVVLPPMPVERRHIVDIEAATLDRATRQLWLALEYHNAVVRFDPSGEVFAIQPDAMRDWGINKGAEAMVRLGDGRFILFRETGGGLLFPGDPLAGGTPERFAFDPPDGFQPSDATNLPDGRLLILLRRLELTFSPFDSMLAVANPLGLEAGGTLEMEVLADLAPGLPRENYEGLVATPRPDGTLDIWLVADDNMAAFQRSLLARLNWKAGP